MSDSLEDYGYVVVDGNDNDDDNLNNEDDNVVNDNDNEMELEEEKIGSSKNNRFIQEQHQEQQQQLLKDEQYHHHQEEEEQYEKEEQHVDKNINNNNNNNHDQHEETPHPSSPSPPSSYLTTQHQRINEDLEDFNNLQEEIERLQLIKTQYKTQKESIQKLGEVVEKLKSENKELRLKSGAKSECGGMMLSNKQEEEKEEINHDRKGKDNGKELIKANGNNKPINNSKNNNNNNIFNTNNKNSNELEQPEQQQLEQQQYNEQQQTNNSRVSFSSGSKVVNEYIRKKSIERQNLSSNRKWQEELQHRQQQQNFINVNKQQPQRSPMVINKRPFNTSQNFYPSRQQQQYQSPYQQHYDPYPLSPTPTDHHHIIRNHVTNKHSIISNFVSELKQELEQNEQILQQEKRSHRETKEKLENCLELLKLIHLRLEENKNLDLLERECVRLKNQLETEVEERLLIEEKLREKELLFTDVERQRITSYEQFDHELDKMDEIYFNLEATLKL